MKVSIQEKRFFIQWFLKHYQLKNHECSWILKYLITDDILLNNIHFVREAHYCPRAIIMTSCCSNDISFRFHKKHVITKDVDKSFHDLRLHKHQSMYMQINFYQSHQHPNYLAVLEENPYAPKDTLARKQDRVIAQRLLEYSLYKYKQKLFKKRIDRALDENNQEEFYKLVNQLQTLHPHQ